MLYGFMELLFYAMKEFHRLEPPDFALWLLLAGGLAFFMEGVFFLSGRLVHLDWTPRWLLGSLATLAFPLSFILFLSLPASTYIKPAAVKILNDWQGDFLSDQAWNGESFREQYWAIRALKKPDGSPLENFAKYPPPEQGGHLIPAGSKAAQALMSDIDSRRVAEHFQAHHALLAKLLWTQDRPLPDVLRIDMEKFFQEHPGSVYDHGKSVQLAGAEMQILLESKIGRIVLTTRIVLVTLLVFLWLPLCGWAMYDAWKKLEPTTG